MQAVKLPASAGIDWLLKGFAIFKKRPGLFVLLAFIWNFNTIISLQLLGALGLFTVALVQPVYIAFILFCCHQINQGQKFTLNDLFEPFRDSKILKSLLIAGFTYGVIFFILDMFFTPSLVKESEVANVIASTADGEITAETYAALAASINPIAIFAMILYTVFLTLVYWFVPALIMWNRVEVVKSIVFSCIGVMRNFSAFVTMGVPAVAIGFVVWSLILVAIFSGGAGAFLAFILQIILISLLMTIYCAMYISYKQIYQSS
ncbi:MAG: BPSS1780 family membrane protein [Alcaligenaceae bacterium]|nr:BPSS1780 family membrane protein [Alcaligenaceae bacterium]